MIDLFAIKSGESFLNVMNEIGVMSQDESNYEVWKPLNNWYLNNNIFESDMERVLQTDLEPKTKMYLRRVLRYSQEPQPAIILALNDAIKQFFSPAEEKETLPESYIDVSKWLDEKKTKDEQLSKNVLDFLQDVEKEKVPVASQTLTITRIQR